MDVQSAQQWLETNEHWVVPLGELVAILAVVASAAAYFWRNITATVGWFVRRRPRITFGDRDHDETRLTFVLAEHRSFWHAEHSGTPRLQLVAEWFVTNLSRGSVRILSARFERPRAPGTEQCVVHIMTDDEPLARSPEDVQISRGETVRLSLVSMMAPPPRHREHRPLKVRAVVVDQHEHKHHTPLALIPNR